MFYNPDKFDAVIVILKFLAVFSSGLLTGEALYVSRTLFPSMMAVSNVENALSRFRYFWLRGLQMYETALVGSFAGFAVCLLEVRDRFYWFYGAFGLLAIFLYTKFHLCPRVINYLLDPDFSKKGEMHIHDMLVKFHRGHHPRTLLSAISFIWLIYSLYMS